MDFKNLCFMLTKLPLFSGFSDNDINDFLKKVNYQIKTFNKNETIFFRGDTLENVIILMNGSAKAEMQKFDGHTIIIEHFTKPQIIASAFIFGSSSILPVDLIATEKSNFLFLNKKSFIFFLENNNNKFLLNFLNDISNKTQLLSKRTWFNFTNKTISEKILTYIKENEKNNIIIFKPNLSELSKKFEVTRPSLSREVSSLCDKGLLTKIKNNTYKVDFSKI